jgi:Phage portal protein, SPP1 Gp6-like
MTTFASPGLAGELMNMDRERMDRYRQYLGFYDGRQWPDLLRPGEKRITFNYARIFVRKTATYLLGQPAGIMALPADESAEAATRAARMEKLLYHVHEQNGLESADFDTAIDSAVLGDGAYKVTWDGVEKRVVVRPVDPQSLYAWHGRGDFWNLERVCEVYRAGAEDIFRRWGARIPGEQAAVVEEWTLAKYTVHADSAVVHTGPNPYGFIPYVIFPNIRRPKEFWGESDLADLLDPCRELNRRLSVLSSILEISGNPIAVLENVENSEGITVGPGALWELPEKAKAYLLDLLSGGGVGLHIDYIEKLYRAIHDIAETPRTAFGDSGRVITGVALEVEMQPLLQKVTRKRAVWSEVIRRRSRMELRLMERFAGLEQCDEVRIKAVWPSMLPQDYDGLVKNEIAMVNGRLHSLQTAMEHVGVDVPEVELGKVLENVKDFESLELPPSFPSPFSHRGRRGAGTNDQ